jgi:hypothetical protein
MSGLRINHPTGPGPDEGDERWATDELREQFEVLGFAAPYVVVRRKADGVKGTLQFVQNPGEERVYFGWFPA